MTEATAEQPTRRAPRQRRLAAAARPSLPQAENMGHGCRLFLVGLVVLLSGVTGENAISNIVFFICTTVAVVILLVWFTCFSGYARSLRWSPIAGIAAAAALFPCFFRYVGVSGELVPQFELRDVPLFISWLWPSEEEPLRVPDAPNKVTQAKLAELPSETTSFQARHDARMELIKSAEQLADLATTTPEDFPRFLGRHADQTVRNVQLAANWDANPPELVWQQEIGEGWSAFAAVNGYAVTMEQRRDEESEQDFELVTCYEIETGELVWSHKLETIFDAGLGAVMGGIGPRATPAIDEGRVYALGGTGILRCIDGNTGLLIWQRDLLKEFKIPYDVEVGIVHYGRSNSPLVTGGMVIVPAGGPGSGRNTSLVAYDKLTGEQVWRGGEEQIAYASPIRARLLGVDQVLTVNESSVAGHDLLTGKELWQTEWPGRSNADASNSQPVPIGDDQVFISKHYGFGSALIQLSKNGDKFKAENVGEEHARMKTKFTNVVVHQGYVYGLSDGILECIELKTGELMWKRGRYGHGQILGVGDVLLVMHELTGKVSMVSLDPDGYEEMGTFQALDRAKTWNNLAMYGPYLLVRNAEQAACWKLPTAP